MSLRRIVIKNGSSESLPMSCSACLAGTVVTVGLLINWVTSNIHQKPARDDDTRQLKERMSVEMIRGPPLESQGWGAGVFSEINNFRLHFS